jgi:hypothetical protein
MQPHLMGAGIAQWYGAGVRAGWLGVRLPVGVGNFSLHHRVQTSSGAHPASCPMDTRGSFPGGKAAGAWSYTSSPPLHLHGVVLGYSTGTPFTFTFISPNASFEAFTAVMFQVAVFWVVKPCSVVVGYRRFRGPRCLHRHFTMKMEAAWTSETSVSYTSPPKT